MPTLTSTCSMFILVGNGVSWKNDYGNKGARNCLQGGIIGSLIGITVASSVIKSVSRRALSIGVVTTIGQKQRYENSTLRVGAYIGSSFT